MQVATTAADLTAQVKSVTKYDIADIQAASKSILTPYSTAPLKIVLSSVVADDNNVGKGRMELRQRRCRAGTGTTYKVPTGLTEAESSVIVAEVTYGFQASCRPQHVLQPWVLQHDADFLFAPPAQA